MITGIYRSTGGVTGIINNCRATEAETHSDTQRNRGKEAGREEEMTAGKYKLFRLYESDKDRNNKFRICGSFPRHYFSSISLPLPTVDAGTRQFLLIHHYIIILQSSNNLSSTTFLF
jgi:hypothetical protein